MAKVQRISAGRVTADFFTGNYRFSATAIVYKRRLVDVLGDHTTDFLELIDIYVSRINNPGSISATYSKGILIKQEIDFVLISSETEGISKERFYSKRNNIPIFMSIPNFEITGQFQWGQTDLDLKKFLTSDTQKFLPISDATATNALVPEVTFQGPIALVNRAKLQVVCPAN